MQAAAAELYRAGAFPGVVGDHLPPPGAAPATVSQEVAAAARGAFDEAFGKGGQRLAQMGPRCSPAC